MRLPRHLRRHAAPPAAATFVDLGTAATYSVLGGPASRTRVPAPCSQATSGSAPPASIAGFPPGIVNGTIHDKDAAAEIAQSDRADAYADAAGQTSTTTFAGDQGGKTFHPGVHTTSQPSRTRAR